MSFLSDQIYFRRRKTLLLLLLLLHKVNEIPLLLSLDTKRR
jgi:hypothetical protein